MPAVATRTIGPALSFMLWLHPSAAQAQEIPPPGQPQSTPPPVQCWEVVTPMRGTDSPTMVMLNRCTGDSWLLAKVSVREATPTTTGAFVYRWRRISKPDDAKEAEFPIPSVPLR
jgi:hypothetical protein